MMHIITQPSDLEFWITKLLGKIQQDNDFSTCYLNDNRTQKCFKHNCNIVNGEILNPKTPII
jgi:hypothetical protein